MRLNPLLGGAVLIALWAVASAACGDSSEPKPAPSSSAGATEGGETGAAAGPSQGGASSPGAAGGAAEPAGGAGQNASPEGGAAGSEGALGGASAAGGASECPPGPPGKPPSDYLTEYASGTRIQARFYSAPGMPAVFAGFYDTQLDTWCDFLLASDDKLRCLPRSTITLGVPGYADAGCQNDVTILPHSCSAGFVRSRLDCQDKAEVRGTKPFSGTLHNGSPANCQVGQTAPADSVTAGDAMAPSSFALGTLVELPGVCQAGLRVVETADGARGPFEAYDIESGAGCNTSSGTCKPSHLAYEEPLLFSDDSCMTAFEKPLASSINEPSCAPPDFVFASIVAGQGKYYEVGDAVTSGVYSNISGCASAFEKPWIHSLFVIGELAAPLAPLEPAWLGTGRLQVQVASEAGTPLAASVNGVPQFRDQTLDSPCFMQPQADGTLVCIPSDIITQQLSDEYNDPSCTQPLRRCTGDGCVGKIVWDAVLQPDSCSSEQTLSAIWRIKAPATAYYRKDGAAPCYAAGDVDASMWTVDSVDPKTLASAKRQTAP